LNPSNISDQVELAVSYIDSSDFQINAAGDVTGGFDYDKRGVAILDRAAQIAPDNMRIVTQSIRGYTDLGKTEVGQPGSGRLGTIAEGIADLQKALSLIRRAIELSPSNREVRGKEGGVELVLGDAFSKLGDRSKALTHYRRALDVFNGLSSKEDSLSVANNRAVVLERIGEIVLVSEKPSEAIHWYADAKQTVDRLAPADPHNELLRRLVVTSTGNLGHALVETGKIDEGLRQIRYALEILTKVSAPKPLDHMLEGIGRSWVGEGLELQGRLAEAAQEYTASKQLFAAVRKGGTNDVLAQVYFGSATLHLGTALAKLGKVDEGRSELGEALAVLEPLSNANSDNQEVLYAVAETYTGEGLDAMMSAEQLGTNAKRQSEWVTAREFFRKSLSTWERVANPARISTTGLRVTLPGQVSELLARCDREIGLLDGHPSR
jgi:tetratricopeptide (TPR) repeat protein